MGEQRQKKIVDLVDKIFVVSLPARVDRHREMEQELASVGWDDPAKVVWYPALDPRSAAGFPSPGVRGCFASHLGALNAAKNLGCRTVMILEDDCELSACKPAVEARIHDALTAADFGICMLGHSHPHVADGPLIISAEPKVGIGLLHCYLVSDTILTELCRYLEAIWLKPLDAPGLGPMHVDGAHNHFRQDTGCVTLVVNPPVAHQRSSRSDLSTRWFDRVPFVSGAAQWARRMKRSGKTADAD